MKISASYLSSENKKETIKKLNDTTIDYLHIDYMDGKFTKNKTETLGELTKLLKNNKKPLDVHLMALPTKKIIESFALLNTEYITIHLETENVKEYLELIKNYGIKVGLSIKPKTNIKNIFKYLEDIDLALIMSVKPGEGGQTFLEDTKIRISTLKEEILQKGYNIQISVDGGINKQNIESLKELEIDMVVVGSFITKEDNYQNQINKLK